jgi:hypothetical protein
MDLPQFNRSKRISSFVDHVYEVRFEIERLDFRRSRFLYEKT